MEQTLQQTVLQELQSIALARTTDVVGVQGGALVVKDTDSLPDGVTPAIASIEKTSVGFKIKFYDKLKALELLGKCTGLFDDAMSASTSADLLGAIVKSTKEDLQDDEISELQQAAAAGNDLVEQAQMEKL